VSSTARPLLFGALLLALAPARASAWADASVRSVQAEVVLAPDGSARVSIITTMRVHGGWLEGFELAGLDPDLVLAQDAPPWATDEAGERWAPTAEVLTGGRVQLAFSGHSPRRGTLRVGLTYQTSLAHRATAPVEDEDLVRVSWTLPGWRSGLDGVEITIVAPRGTRFGPRDETDSGASLETNREELGATTRLRWRRAHLPRTVAWTVAVDVPSSAMIAELRAPPELAPPPAPRDAEAPTQRRDPIVFWLALSLGIAVLAALSVFGARRRAQRSRTTARGLVPSPLLVRVLAIVIFAPASVVLGMAVTELGLGALALLVILATFRTAGPSRAPQLGAWRPLDVRWLGAVRRSRWSRWLSPWTLTDATTPLGAIALLAWIAAPFALDGGPFELCVCAAVLPLPLFLGGTRLAFPTAPPDAAIALLAACRKLRALPEGVALRPVAYIDVRGELAEVRVRTVLERRPRGLLRLDLVVIEAERAGGWERGIALLAVTREGSDAERALAERAPELAAESSPGGRRIARVASIDRLGLIVDALRECPEAPMPARGTTSPQQTVHELPAPRAVGI
jgi:hypothetical protein